MEELLQQQVIQLQLLRRNSHRETRHIASKIPHSRGLEAVSETQSNQILNTAAIQLEFPIILKFLTLKRFKMKTSI